MPITLKPNKVSFKDANGDYFPQDVISDYDTADLDAAVAQMEADVRSGITQIEQKTAESIASIPDDYTALSGDVSELKSNLTFNASWLTKYLLPNEGGIELTDLATPSATNVRSVMLYGNVIKKRVTASKPNGSTYLSFLISGTPRYLGGTATVFTGALTDADFKPLFIHEDSSLCMTINRRFNRKTDTNRAASPIFIGTYSKYTPEGSEEEQIQIDYVEMGAYSTEYDTDRYITETWDLTERLPQLRTNQNIAIVIEARYPNVEEDLTITFSMKGKGESLDFVADQNSSMIASKRYAVNDFIIANSTFYKVTQPIASGAQIIVGTNVEETTIGEQLTLLLNRE